MTVREALRSWHWLNEALRDCDEAFASKLLKYERDHLNRSGFLLRIHSRINRLRRERERVELT